MLGVDGATQDRWGREARKEREKSRLQRTLQHDIETNTVSVQADDGHDVSNVLEQIGKPLSRQQVISKLRLCNSRLVFEEAKADPSKWGIYVIGHVKTAVGTWEEQKQFVCGMEAGVMPELSVLHKIKVKKPNPELIGNPNPTREVDWIEVETFAGETRGWRTVLARLLHARLITESDVTRHFGWTPHRPSEKWHNATQFYPGE